MKITVIGLGKIGLPLAVQYARKNHDVIGVDINQITVDLINNAVEPFPGEKNLQDYLSEVIESKKLYATTDFEESISISEVIVVVVPLFVDEYRNPDFSSIDLVSRMIGQYMQRGSLICYETTLPIGTTRTRFTSILQTVSNLTVGTDFNVVFSPERVFTGRVFEDLQKYPKIVGGVTNECGIRGFEFYTQVLDFSVRKDLSKSNGVWLVKNSETAEFVKLAETTYRDVNIALANEFALHAEEVGVDIYEVINASNSQIYSNIHQPGISVGGHCIPVYPQFYTWGDHNSRVVRTTRQTNEEMPRRIVNQIIEEIGSLRGKKCLIMGASYRPNVKEVAFSGTFTLVKLLEEERAKVQVLDPFYSTEEIQKIGWIPFDGKTKELDIVIIHTSHGIFNEFFNQELSSDIYIYDGRNFFSSNRPPKDAKLHILGRGLNTQRSDYEFNG